MNFGKLDQGNANLIKRFFKSKDKNPKSTENKPEVGAVFSLKRSFWRFGKTPSTLTPQVKNPDLPPAEEGGVNPLGRADTIAPPNRALEPLEQDNPEPTKVTQGGFFARLQQGLSKTRAGFAHIFIGKKQIDDDFLEELETQLLLSDMGAATTSKIIEQLTIALDRGALNNMDSLRAKLHTILKDSLAPVNIPLRIPKGESPFVILVVGVNGGGKTTTIGKLAKQLQVQGCKVLLAAGDTFRAAAVEQLQAWGARNDIPVIAQQMGADSAAVIFDAMQAAKARNVDVLIADTAGRLHNKEHLMAELGKVKKVMSRLDPAAPHETLLVLDAGTGQNALSQVRLFHQTLKVTGMVLTKLDGTAKGGVVFALAGEYGIPIRFLGMGEGIDDLQIFKAEKFVNALLQKE